MGRLINDLTWSMSKKPKSIIHYISPTGKLTEIPFQPQFQQGIKIFEMKDRNNDKTNKWILSEPPYTDELNREVYICPYDSLNNIRIDATFKDESYSKKFGYLNQALYNEWCDGVEWERRRQENKPKKKNGLPIVTILLIVGAILFVLVLGGIALIYFGGGA